MHLKNTFSYIVRSALFIVLVSAGDAGALSMGKAEFQPYVSVKEIFTDNVFSTPADEKRDRVTYYTPGARFIFPFSVHRLDLSYSAVLARYDKYRSEKTDDHRAQGSIDLKFGSRVNLTLSDSYSRDHEPRSSSTTGFIEKFKMNTGMGILVYQLVDRSKVQIDYAKTSWSFRNSTFRNREEDLVAGYLYYRFLPKTSFFLEYDRKSIDFAEDATPYDNTMKSFLLGLTWEISAQSRGTVKAGRTEKDFKSRTVNDDDVWTSSVDIRHDFTQYTSIMLVGSRSINESNRIGSRFSLTTGLYGEAVHRFGYHLSSVVHGSMAIDRFSDIVPPETVLRKDEVFTWGGGLKYLVQKWLELSADYTQRARNSNVDTNDYREHQYILMLSASL